MAGALTKPVLRRHLNTQIRTNIIVASVLTAITGVLFSTLYTQPHKRQYAEFYRTYDINAEFKRMKDLGLFQACKKGDE